jgi:3-methylcrotonyl-CoA carboxylase beta subunit
MTVLASQVNPRSDEFRRNAEAMRAQVDDLKAVVRTINEGGGAEARARHLARNKLLPRERVRMLLDPGSPSSSCRSWRPMACTEARCRPAAS